MPPVVAALAAALVAIGVGASTAAVIAQIVVTAVTVAGLSELARLLTPKPKIAEHKQNVRQAIAPRRKCYGRVKIGGIYGFLAVRTPTLYYELLLCSHEIDAIEDHWLGEYTVDIDGSGNVTLVNESATPHIYQLDDGVYIANIQNQMGTAGQTAFADLLSAFPETYTSDDRCRGIATALLQFKDPGSSFGTRYPAGLPPYNATIRGAKVYDPRDVTQHQNDPSTWKWSENGVLIVMDYIWNADGMRLPWSLISPAIDVWKAQADVADALVALKDGGTEPRYRLGGTYEFTDPPKQVLPRMLEPMDARLGLRADGAIVIDVGQWYIPSDTITDDQVVSYIGLARGAQQADVKNEFRASFVSPDYKFVEAEMDPWLNEASIDVDGLKTATLDLTWSPSHRQARVRAKIEAYRQSADAWRGQIVTNAYGLKFLEPNSDGTKKRNINFTIAELGIAAVPFEVQRFAFDPKSGRCTFTVIQMTPDAYAWDPDTDEGVAPALPESIAPDGIENPSSLTVTVNSEQHSGGGLSKLLDAQVPNPVQQGLNWAIQYAVHNDLIADADKTWIDMTKVGSGPLEAKSGLLVANTYDVRTAFYNSRGFYSDYIYERGFVVSYGTAPNPPANLTLSSPSAGNVLIAWNDSPSSNQSYSISWRNTSSTFGTATNISGQIYGAANQAMEYADAPGTGTFYYWVTAQDISGDASTPAGPQNITV